jgi:Flp pilus assembly protein TadG
MAEPAAAPSSASTSTRRRFGPLRRARRFCADEHGATAVEFAMISVPFLALLFAIFETAFVFFCQQGVETAVAEAARAIMTGQAQANSAVTTAAQFRDAYICNPTSPQKKVFPAFLTCSNLIVDVRVATSGFSSANMAKDFASNPTTSYCTGGSGSIVIVRAIYPLPVYLDILSMATSSLKSSASGSATVTAGQTNYTSADGVTGMKHMLMGTAAFRNEPFPGTSGAVC